MDLNYLELLPDEMLLKLLLETDDLKTLSKWCQTSKRINNICQDEGLWKEKYVRNFGKFELEEGETWREKYKRKALSGINSPISVGFDHYGIIDRKGNLYMVGDNDKGQLGVGRGIKKSKTPILVNFFPADGKFPNESQKVISLSATFSITGAVNKDGKVYIWGANAKRLLFSYPSDNHYQKMLFLRNDPIVWLPTELIVPGKAIKIVVNVHGYIVLLQDSSIYFSLYHGAHTYDPVMKGHLKLDAIDISLGIEHPILSIITKDHKLYMWGLIGSMVKDARGMTMKPMHVPTPEPAIKISLGTEHVMILSDTGNVYTFGDNFAGGLGIKGNMEKIYEPQLVELPEKIVQIETYHYTSAALSDTGRLYMWGFNYKNKISSSLPEYNFVPVEISFGLSINFVSVGYDNTIAISDDGVVNYWGVEL